VLAIINDWLDIQIAESRKKERHEGLSSLQWLSYRNNERSPLMHSGRSEK
jgi:hypothetical protein